MRTAHKLESETYQWGKVRGGRPEDAMTIYKCIRCGKHFVHRYNLEFSIYKAAEEQGFDLNICNADNSEMEVEQDDDISPLGSPLG